MSRGGPPPDRPRCPPAHTACDGLCTFKTSTRLGARASLLTLPPPDFDDPCRNPAQSFLVLSSVPKQHTIVPSLRAFRRTRPNLASSTNAGLTNFALSPSAHASPTVDKCPGAFPLPARRAPPTLRIILAGANTTPPRRLRSSTPITTLFEMLATGVFWGITSKRKRLEWLVSCGWEVKFPATCLFIHGLYNPALVDPAEFSNQDLRPHLSRLFPLLPFSNLRSTSFTGKDTTFCYVRHRPLWSVQ